MSAFSNEINFLFLTWMLLYILSHQISDCSKLFHEFLKFSIIVRGKSSVLKRNCAHNETSMRLGTVADLNPNVKNPMRTHPKNYL